MKKMNQQRGLDLQPRDPLADRLLGRRARLRHNSGASLSSIYLCPSIYQDLSTSAAVSRPLSVSGFSLCDL
jgi:hypothetical protein